ncbi:MAG: ABC transporter substrate-binding protein, partial [Candidatus Binataceae bacterium]
MVAIALLCAVSTSACSRKAASYGAAGYIQVDINTSPTALDPRFAADAISQRVGELMFDSMLRTDAHGRYVGDLASGYERPSPTVLIFHLRHDLRFSDGRPLTARDVIYTYDSVLDPKSMSVKRAGFTQLANIHALDSYTVEMTTRRPYAPAPQMAMLGIVPYGTPAPRQEASSTPVGSGPFMPVRFVRDEEVVLKRNPERPAPSNAIRGIVFKVVPDATVRALELTEGVCDLAENDSIEPTLIDYLSQQPRLRVILSPGTT